MREILCVGSFVCCVTTAFAPTYHRSFVQREVGVTAITRTGTAGYSVPLDRKTAEAIERGRQEEREKREARRRQAEIDRKNRHDAHVLVIGSSETNKVTKSGTKGSRQKTR